MKKILLGMIIGVSLTLAAYYVSHLFSSTEVMSFDLASVTIKNESGRHVKSVALEHAHGSMHASGLNDKQEVRFVFNNATENAYKVIVVFDDGSSLGSKEVYFEYGYRGIETITSNEIITAHNW